MPLPFPIPSRWADALAIGVSAVGSSILSWGLWTCGRADTASLSPVALGAMTFAAIAGIGVGLSYKRIRLRAWMGGVAGAAGGLALCQRGDLSILVYPFMGLVGGLLSTALLTHNAALKAQSLLNHPQRLIRAAGAWLSVVAGLLYVVGPHAFAPLLLGLSLVGLLLMVATEALRRRHHRWLSNLPSHGRAPFQLSEQEREIPGPLPTVDGPRDLTGKLLMAAPAADSAYRAAHKTPVATIRPRPRSVASVAALVWGVASFTYYAQVDSTDERAIVARCNEARRALADHRWSDARGLFLVEEQPRDEEGLTRAIEDACGAQLGVDAVHVNLLSPSSATAYVVGSGLELGSVTQGWAKISGRWYVVGERSVSLD